jgi:hypothetical protein
MNRTLTLKKPRPFPTMDPSSVKDNLLLIKSTVGSIRNNTAHDEEAMNSKNLTYSFLSHADFYLCYSRNETSRLSTPPPIYEA